MKKILLLGSMISLAVDLSAQTKIYEQYASSLITYSTQYNNATYSAAQILGRPNRYPTCNGDSVWAPSTQNGQREFIEVGYANPQPINTVRIYNTRGQGAVDSVYVRNAGTGTWQQVYSVTAAAATCNESLLEIRFPTTAYNVNAIRFSVNSVAVNDWQEFDAVGIANFDYMNFQWKQYADSVIGFSSQYSTTSWSAQQTLGPPNAGMSCSSNGNAWASLTQNGQREFIVLFYAYPAVVNRIRIFQIDDPGAVDTVYLRNAATGVWNKIFDTSGHSKICPQQSVLEINFTKTTYNVDAVRLALNSPLATGWNEIDAVELVSDLPPNARLSNQPGNWSSTSTWAGGVLPAASDTVIIGYGHNVTVDGNYAIKSMFINQNGTITLNNAANSLTLGPAGGGKEYLQVQGTVAITNGTLNVNGNIDFFAGSSFNMSNGNIVVDGNNGTSNGSVGNGIHLFNLQPGMATVNFTAGMVTVVDPQYHASGQCIAGNYTFGSGSVLKIGNGASTTGGNNPNGFGGNEYYPTIGHFILDATTGAGNRHFGNAWTVNILGNATITSGELRPQYSFIVGGDLTNNTAINVAAGSFSVKNDFINNASGTYQVPGGGYTSIGDDLINNGSFSSGWLYMANDFGVSGNEQTISGTGTFNIYGLEPHNNHPNGVTLLLPLTIQSLYFSTDPGKLFIGNNDLTIQQLAYGAPHNNAYLVINGTGRLIVQNITASDKLFPIGTTNYTPVSIGNGGGHNFAASIRTGLTNAPLNTSVVNREWNITDMTGGSVNAVLKFQWNAADENAGFNRGSCYGGRYNGSWAAVSPYGPATGTDPYTRTVTNVSGFSPFAIGSSGAFGPPLAPLPLHLVNFSVNKCNGNVCLQWNTESEINVSHYEVEKSRDAVTFEKITSLAAQNRSSAYYTTTDKAISTGVAYYRLKGVDIDGKSTYSKIVKLDFGKNYTVFISPNPVKDKLYIQGAENFKTISIIDRNGRLVKQMRPTPDNNYDVKFLQPGMYWLRFVNDKEMQTHKLIKE